ncbi:hypothetical protein TWF106_007068 [Orbilia oligospora]|uniref:Uncharacterized protein n=1 Tax=Orbilia oligospora TaxID=2813651 RepID=A0A6G1MJE4_ORBOL|nr:hypothetical protein TWF788_007496 [Orbilia oligospora]KAF3213168.1 hypothetical protein TWF679_005394 [Orbilia oligospora]KAF3219645.1 hypothetical protein TWF106_007068 [Orbilia oligospora]KAF3230302.1 hypothetical protein TWF191_010188 [Orbilia oligospora]KAF3260581.1 hypothetical protein TWF192_009862 [Orbilia oligospora]
MASKVKSYFLAPSFDLSPGTIKLGSIIKSINSPHVDKTEPLPIENCLIESVKTKIYHENFVGGSSLFGGISAGFLKSIFGAGADAGVGIARNEERDIFCLNLETKYFEPTHEYLQQSLTNALKDGKMTAYVKSKGFGIRRRRLFMVTGVKIATGVRISTIRWRDTGVFARIEVDAALLAGIPVQTGPTIGFERKAFEKTEFSLDEKNPIVLSYQVTEIIRKKKGEAQSKPYKSGALMSGRFAQNNLADEFELQTEDLDTDGCTIDDFGIGDCLVPNIGEQTSITDQGDGHLGIHVVPYPNLEGIHS